jgi:hypothetical protein
MFSLADVKKKVLPLKKEILVPIRLLNQWAHHPCGWENIKRPIILNSHRYVRKLFVGFDTPTYIRVVV